MDIYFLSNKGIENDKDFRLTSTRHSATMAPNILHLPNGQTITVTSVYGGLYFKSNDLSTHQQSHMPPGWTIVLHKEDDEDQKAKDTLRSLDPDDEDNIYKQTANSHVHRYRKPTLRNDAVFISSISNPSNSDFKPAVSQTRGIAMMLWATLWWYFHQVSPNVPELSFTQ